MMSKALRSMGLCLALGAAGMSAQAATYTNQAAGGDWNTAATWGAANFPTNGDTAVVTSNGTVTLAGAAEQALNIGTLKLGAAGGAGTQSQSGSGSLLSVTNFYVGSVGAGGAGLFNLTGGTFSQLTAGVTANIGYDANGTAVVNGATAVFQAASLYVGYGTSGHVGQGMLIASNGATLVSSNLYVNVSGSQLQFGGAGLTSTGRIGALTLGSSTAGNTGQIYNAYVQMAGNLTAGGNSSGINSNSLTVLGVANGALGNTVVDLGGKALNVGQGQTSAGGAAIGNRFVVDGNGVFQGAMVTNLDGSFTLGLYGGSGQVGNNSIIVTNGGYLQFGAGSANTSTLGANSDSNRFYVGANSLVIYASTKTLAIGASGYKGNVLVVDGGTMSNTLNNLYIAGSGNGILVTNGGQLVVSVGAGEFDVARTTGVSSNNITVTGAGSLLSVAGPVYMGGYGAIATGSTVNVSNGGQFVGTSFYIGKAPSGGGDQGSNCNQVVTLASSGLLELSTITVAKDATSTDNYLTNSGGILQFTTATPSITINNAGNNGIVMTNATLSYRNVSSVNITNNWNPANADVYKFTWQGANTFRLDNSTGLWSTASTYVFATNQTQGARNFAGLELVNGVTAFNGKGIQLDGDNGGSLLLSNTTASITGGVVLVGSGPVPITAGGTNASLTGVISGAGSLMKLGAGTLTLTSSNTYNGATTISAGTLALSNSGSIRASATITLAGGGLDVRGLSAGVTNHLAGGQRLQGTGIYQGGLIVDPNATVAPGVGAAVGTLTFTNAPVMTLSVGATNLFKLVTDSSYDTYVIGAGSLLDLGGAILTLSNPNGTVYAADTPFTIITGSVSNQFSSGTAPVSDGVNTYTVTYNSSSVVLTAIPEPAVLGLLLVAALGLMRRMRR